MEDGVRARKNTAIGKETRGEEAKGLGGVVKHVARCAHGKTQPSAASSNASATGEKKKKT